MTALEAASRVIRSMVFATPPGRWTMTMPQDRG